MYFRGGVETSRSLEIPWQGALSDITNKPTVDTTTHNNRTAQMPQPRAINSMTVH